MKAKSIFIFAIGAAVGAVASYFATKRLCDIRKQAEIESVKEVFSKRAAAREKPDLSEFAEVVEREGYSAQTNEEKPTPKVKGKVPYVISPDEFAEDEDYEKISLTYYADGVLVDEEDDVVDVSIIGGEDILNEFGAFEEDAVYVRNDERKADYEILEDERTFKEVMSKSPQKMGGRSD